MACQRKDSGLVGGEAHLVAAAAARDHAAKSGARPPTRSRVHRDSCTGTLKHDVVFRIEKLEDVLAPSGLGSSASCLTG